MKKHYVCLKFLLLVLCCCFLCFMFTACNSPAVPTTPQETPSATAVISFESNGGSDVSPLTATVGQLAVAPVNPTKGEKIFAGWYSDQALTQRFDFNADTVAGDMTLYARWADVTDYFIKEAPTGATMEGNNIEFVVENDVIQLDLSALVALDEPAEWILAYDEDGTQRIDNKVAGTYEYLHSGDNRFYILTMANGTIMETYSLNVYRKYGVTVAFFFYSQNLMCEYDAFTKELLNPEETPDARYYDGYTITGWKTSSGEVWDVESDLIEDNLSLWAILDPDDFTITLDVAGGTLVEGAATQYTVEYGETRSYPVPTKVGHNFNGWFLDDVPYTNSAGVGVRDWYTLSNGTLVAHYVPLQYKVELNRNTYSGGTINGSGKYSYGSSITVETTVNEGYTFIGWYDAEDRLVSEKLEYTFTLGAADVALEAKYVQYTVSTSVNEVLGGTCTELAEAPYSAGASVTATATPNTGYVFTGWLKADDIVSTSNTYTFNMPEESFELVACFTLCVEHTANADHVCTKCGVEDHAAAVEAEGYCVHGTPGEDGAVMYFGFYPQTRVYDTALLSELGGYNDNTWTSYNLWQDDKKSNYQGYDDFMKYCDKVVDGVKYRGVYISSYRNNDVKTYQYNGGKQSNTQEGNGYKKYTVYWFKYEPVKWNIDKVRDTTEYELTSAYVIDSREFDYNRQSGTITSNNIWRDSSIRTWLNSDFLTFTFTSAQQDMINTSTIKNDEYSAMNGTYGNWSTRYTTEDTQDKVYLLSYAEANSAQFAYNAALDEYVRGRSATDYAKCMGVVYSRTSGFAEYLLRSPSTEGAGDYVGRRLKFVDLSGHMMPGDWGTDSAIASYTNIGLLPAVRVQMP